MQPPGDTGKMARTVRSAPLETRNARLRLKPRPRPYYVATGKKGVSLGYRRRARGNGSWIVKRYIGEPDFAALHQLVETLLAQT